MRVVGQRNAADVHAQQAGGEVDRQCEHGDDGQHEEAAVGLLVDLRGHFFLQQLHPLLQRHHVAQHHGELFRRIAQVLHVQIGHPHRRVLEQAEQCRRLRQQQPLQAHQQPPHRAQARALVVQASGEQLVLHVIDLQRGPPHQVDQHVGLVPQQLRQQVGGRAHRLAIAHRHAQLVDRAQRLAAPGDQQAAVQADPQRGGVGRLEEEVELQVVDHRQQHLLDPLHAG